MSQFQSQQSQLYKISPAHNSFLLSSTMFFLPFLIVLLFSTAVVVVQNPALLHVDSLYLGLQFARKSPLALCSHVHALLSPGVKVAAEVVQNPALLLVDSFYIGLQCVREASLALSSHTRALLFPGVKVMPPSHIFALAYSVSLCLTTSLAVTLHFTRLTSELVAEMIAVTVPLLPALAIVAYQYEVQLWPPLPQMVLLRDTILSEFKKGDIEEFNLRFVVMVILGAVAHVTCVRAIRLRNFAKRHLEKAAVALDEVDVDTVLDKLVSSILASFCAVSLDIVAHALPSQKI
ncbi:hypothetical protein B0H11DRAFT_2090498 [Mycena galericulata]|nr:hypothetical protein B0H11DRAFT_2090498 [Mycena galericulata]